MSDNWKWMTPPAKSFAGLPVFTRLNERETAPDAIRRQTSIFRDHLNHYDFDFNDTPLGDREIQIVDCGDVDKQFSNAEQHPEHHRHSHPPGKGCYTHNHWHR